MLLPRQLAGMKLGVVHATPDFAHLDPRAFAVEQPPSTWARIINTPRAAGRNNQYGDCVPTAGYNCVKNFLARKGIITPANDDLPVQIYTDCGGFPADVGLVPQVFFDWWMQNEIEGVKLLSRAAIDVTDVFTIKSTIVTKGFVFATLTLDVAQQNQLEWTPVGGPLWGKHGVCLDQFEAADIYGTSWGEEKAATFAFLAQQGVNIWKLELG